jgi:hypothetical protein
MRTYTGRSSAMNAMTLDSPKASVHPDNFALRREPQPSAAVEEADSRQQRTEVPSAVLAAVMRPPHKLLLDVR